MMPATSAALEELAPARMAVYRFLQEALRPPTAAQHAWLVGPAFAEALACACEPFGLSVPTGELVPPAYADHEARYLACFEVGLPGPPVPLLASHYNRREPAQRVLHEHILFYRCFGLAVSAQSAVPADHLVHQLAFLMRLDELVGRVERPSLLLARRDFLERHVVAWVGRAAAAAEEKHLPPLYCALLALAAEAVAQDRELTARAQEGP
jgi:DMSO reductase family type II enzyme chaperone